MAKRGGKFYRLERGTNLTDNPPFGTLVRTNIAAIRTEYRDR